jgi:hypothetical protein
VDRVARRPRRHGAARRSGASTRGFAGSSSSSAGVTVSTSSACCAVRAVTPLPLQVDVNEYWTLRGGARAAAADAHRQYCEQPLPAGDPDGPELKRRSPVPIYLDEDCHTLADIAACAERGHGLTIKLAKSGGSGRRVRMVHAARALGLGVMLGCMVESGLGIAPGAHIASLCDHVDLDGNLLLAADPWPGVELRRRRPTPFGPAGSRCRARVGSLILAEGYSADPHYGKTARGVMRYRPRGGRGDPRLRHARARLRGDPNCRRRRGGARARSRRRRSSASRRRVGASRPPGGSCCGAASPMASIVESGLHEFISDDRGAGGLAARTGDAARPAQAAARSRCPDRRQPHPSRRPWCSPSARTARSGR